MPRDRPCLVILDCDGTLVDTERLVKAVLAEALTELGCPVSLETLLQRFRGGHMADFLAYAKDRVKGPLPTQFEAKLRHRIKARIQTKLMPMQGAETLLSAINLPVCVASNGPRAYVHTCLQSSNLARFFEDKIFSAYDVGAWKPDPEVFLAAARKMGAQPQDCIVVEDSLVGLTAARNAGMRQFFLDASESVCVDHDVTHLRTLPMLLEHL